MVQPAEGALEAVAVRTLRQQVLQPARTQAVDGVLLRIRIEVAQDDLCGYPGGCAHLGPVFEQGRRLIAAQRVVAALTVTLIEVAARGIVAELAAQVYAAQQEASARAVHHEALAEVRALEERGVERLQRTLRGEHRRLVEQHRLGAATSAGIRFARCVRARSHRRVQRGEQIGPGHIVVLQFAEHQRIGIDGLEGRHQLGALSLQLRRGGGTPDPQRGEVVEHVERGQGDVAIHGGHCGPWRVDQGHRPGGVQAVGIEGVAEHGSEPGDRASGAQGALWAEQWWRGRIAGGAPIIQQDARAFVEGEARVHGRHIGRSGARGVRGHRIVGVHHFRGEGQALAGQHHFAVLDPVARVGDHELLREAQQHAFVALPVVQRGDGQGDLRGRDRAAAEYLHVGDAAQLSEALELIHRTGHLQALPHADTGGVGLVHEEPVARGGVGVAGGVLDEIALDGAAAHMDGRDDAGGGVHLTVERAERSAALDGADGGLCGNEAGEAQQVAEGGQEALYGHGGPQGTGAWWCGWTAKLRPAILHDERWKTRK